MVLPEHLPGEGFCQPQTTQAHILPAFRFRKMTILRYSLARNQLDVVLTVSTNCL